MLLKDKVVIVTGGSGLIGKAIITHLTNEGAVVVNADISLEGKAGGLEYFVDINNPESIKSVIDCVIAEHKTLDGFVSNAYPKPKGYGTQSFTGTSHQQWSEFVHTNLNGYYLCAYYALEAMKKRGVKGSFVNVASIYGYLAPDFNLYENTTMNFPGEYTLVKGGIINFTRFLAATYGKDGIRVNAVSPGGIFNHQDPIFMERYNKKVMLGRMGDPREVAEPIAFLLSDHASYVTAHNLIIDGGLSAA
jgi:NAD(P)-dependent dehydrogenase (short-subunit alcohol dehydrogenase family)